MDELLGLQPDSADIYITDGMHESVGVSKDDYVKEYEHWHLILQPKNKRAVRGVAAGLLVAKRKVVLATELLPEEWAELSQIMKNAPKELCKAIGVEFSGHFTAGFNVGAFAGQTQAQVHIHIYPVTVGEEPKPGVRNGLGAMVEALRNKNLKTK